MLAPAPTRRVARATRWVAGTARTVPGSLIWSGALLVTTALAARMSTADLDQILLGQSTNLANLAVRPVEVMIGSALWDGHPTWWYLLMFTALLAVVERWLGTGRWLAVVLGAHVIGTVVSEGYVAVAIGAGALPTSMATTDDFGVSYALAGAMAVLAHRLRPGARGWYVAAVLAIYTAPFWLRPLASVTFTDIGHLTAALVGLAAWPLVRHRAGSAERRSDGRVARVLGALGAAADAAGGRAATSPVPAACAGRTDVTGLVDLVPTQRPQAAAALHRVV